MAWKSRWSCERFVNTADVEHDPVDAVLGERVRRDLHRDRAHPAGAHPREQPLQVRRLGRRPGERPGAPSIRTPVVPITPGRHPPRGTPPPAGRSSVVLPFVPVTPTTVMRRRRVPEHGGRDRPHRRADRRHDAPGAAPRPASARRRARRRRPPTASAAKSWPSTSAPGTQKKSAARRRSRSRTRRRGRGSSASPRDAGVRRPAPTSASATPGGRSGPPRREPTRGVPAAAHGSGSACGGQRARAAPGSIPAAGSRTARPAGTAARRRPRRRSCAARR